MRKLWMLALPLVLASCAVLEFGGPEKAMIFTAEDYMELSGEAFTVPETALKRERYVFADLSGMVRYEYDSPPEAEQPLLLQTWVEVEAKTREAVSLFEKNLKTFSSQEKLTYKEDNAFFKWGDQSSHGTYFNANKKPVGTLVVARKGRMVYTFVISGVYFGDKEMLEEVLKPRLEKAAAYQPYKFWGRGEKKAGV